MKKLITIMTICFLSFLSLTSINAQNTFPWPSSGSIGIGTAGPGEYLEVAGGNIDISTATKRFKLGGNDILWHNSDVSSIFVGVGAGAGSGTSAVHNTFVGNNAGYTDGGGSSACVFVGAEAGHYASAAVGCTFLGAKAGFELVEADGNTYVGFEAGRDDGIDVGTPSASNFNSFFGARSGLINNNTSVNTANKNTFIGAMSGSANRDGGQNSFVGCYSGDGNEDGWDNVSLGFKSGSYNVAGHYNTFIGTLADAGGNGFIESAAIGFGAVVMKDYNMILGGDSVLVGIGLSGDASGPQAKLDVQNDATALANTQAVAMKIAGLFQTYGTAEDGNDYHGILATCGAAGADANNIGGAFAAWGCIDTNIGVYGNADDDVGEYNYGGKFNACNASRNNFAVYGGTCDPGESGAVNFAGYFDGDVFINGPTCGTGLASVTSDAMFKTNIDSITDAMSLLKQLKCRTYFMDTTNVYGLRFSSKRQMGFIAQDIEQILPELVIQQHRPKMFDSTGNLLTQGVDFKALNYIEFIPLLTRGIQELSKTNDSLKADNTKQDSINNSLQNQINDLMQMINECCSQNHSPINMNNTNGNNSPNSTSYKDVKLTDAQSVVLEQNVPNPFAEQTTINYFLPDDISKAQMLFYNANGKLIQSVELNQRGQCALNVFAQDLSSGMYTYTLVVDGKIFETKKMVKQ